MPTLPLQLSTKVVARNDGFIEAAIDDEIVALSIEQSTCYGMNRIASRIWTLLASPIRISDLCAALLATYKVDPDVCERQVLDLLEQFRAEGLIATLRKNDGPCRRCGVLMIGPMLPRAARGCFPSKRYMVRITARNAPTALLRLAGA